jgi:ATP-dependent helicase HrpB
VETARVLPPAGTPGTDLPVRAALPELAAALRSRGTAVLVAPPGTGKTTLVPLALAGQVQGRVVVAEPRRVAARAAARRMSALLGEPPGRSVGHTVRGESTAGPHTRVEVVTTGVLVRRLQRDAELPGVDAVVLDECHERHLDTDLALAFGVDVRSVLRPDLLLLAMSATAQAERLAEVLGRAAVVEAHGALHDVQAVWCPPVPPVAPSFGLRVDPRLLDHVADVVRRAYAETGATCWCSCPARARSPPWPAGCATWTSCRCTVGSVPRRRTQRCSSGLAGGSCSRPLWPRAA